MSDVDLNFPWAVIQRQYPHFHNYHRNSTKFTSNSHLNTPNTNTINNNKPALFDLGILDELELRIKVNTLEEQANYVLSSFQPLLHTIFTALQLTLDTGALEADLRSPATANASSSATAPALAPAKPSSKSFQYWGSSSARSRPVLESKPMLVPLDFMHAVSLCRKLLLLLMQILKLIALLTTHDDDQSKVAKRSYLGSSKPTKHTVLEFSTSRIGLLEKIIVSEKYTHCQEANVDYKFLSNQNQLNDIAHLPIYDLAQHAFLTILDLISKGVFRLGVASASTPGTPETRSVEVTSSSFCLMSHRVYGVMSFFMQISWNSILHIPATNLFMQRLLSKDFNSYLAEKSRSADTHLSPKILNQLHKFQHEFRALETKNIYSIRLENCLRYIQQMVPHDPIRFCVGMLPQLIDDIPIQVFDHQHVNTQMRQLREQALSLGLRVLDAASSAPLAAPVPGVAPASSSDLSILLPPSNASNVSSVSESSSDSGSPTSPPPPNLYFLQLLSILLTNAKYSVQVKYHALFILWRLSFVTAKPTVDHVNHTFQHFMIPKTLVSMLQQQPHDKLLRLSIATLTNLTRDTFRGSLIKSMIGAGLLDHLKKTAAFHYLAYDADVIKDIQDLIPRLEAQKKAMTTFEIYQNEITGGMLQSSPLHDNPELWIDNVDKFDKNPVIVKKLCEYVLHGEEEPLMLRIALNDLAYCFRYIPSTRRVAMNNNGFKMKVLGLMITSNDVSVREKALQCAQWLMLNKMLEIWHE